MQKLTSRPLLEKVAETLRTQGHPLPDGDAPVQLQEMIRAVPVNGTEVVELQAVGTRPEQLAAALNEMLDTLRTRNRQLARARDQHLAMLESFPHLAWRAGLSGDAQERLALNWPGILAEAQAICADPAACADELASAGVETDFPGMGLGGVPDKLTALDAVLCAQGQP